MIERQPKPPIDVGLNRVLLVAEGPHILPGLDGAEFSRRPMFVGAADEKHIVADLPSEARMHIGRKQRSCEIAEVLDAVHVRKRTGNENLGHGSDLSRMRMPNPQQSKSPPATPEGLGFGSCLARKMRALSRPVELHAVGPGHSRRERRADKNHFGISQELGRELDLQELDLPRTCAK